MNQRFKTLAVAAALAVLAVPLANCTKTKDPIKLTLHDWTGQLITTQIMGEVLKKAGYNVEYVQADYLAQFAGLKTGDLHVAMEIWETTGREALDEAVATGKVENLGETGMQAKRGVVVSRLHEGEMPRPAGLGGARRTACAEAFSTPETAPKGRYLGGPVTWGGFDEERVEALEPAVRGGPCRHRCRAVRRARKRLPAQGADHAVDLCAALGAGQVQGRMGRVPGIRAGLLHRPGLGHQPRRDP